MARWRAEALARLPELRGCITAAETIMGLWTELLSAFDDAYRAEPRDESLVARIYSFADWCVLAPRGPDAGHDPLTAVTVAFYEDIPSLPLARDDMPRWSRYAEVAENRQMFSSVIGDRAYEKLLEYMRSNQHHYIPRGQ